MTAAPHTQGDRPLVLGPEDLPAVEAVPLDERDLPASTYELLRRTADAHPGRPALYLLGEGGLPWRQAACWTYGTLLEHVHRTANAFLELGVPEGGVVASMVPNSGAAYAALLGAQAVGIANPVNPMLADDHLAEILGLTGARLLLAPGPGVAPESWAKARRVAARLPGPIVLAAVGSPPDGEGTAFDAVDFDAVAARQPSGGLRTGRRPRPGDLAAYFHTGGTTGLPKVAPHTHAMEVYMAWALGCSGAYLDGSVVLSGLPLFHVNAVHVTGLGPFLHGTPVVSLGPLGYRDKTLMADFWRIIEHYKVTSFSGVPTLYAGLPEVPGDADLSSLRAGAVGAAPLPRKVRRAFEEATKVPMLEGYGLTEATCASAATPAFAPRTGSVGLRLPYQQVKAVTVDASDRPLADCPPGQAGVLAIKGPSVFPGYLRPGPGGPAPDPAGKIFDGWLMTGDLGKVDADGYVYLTGRAKDLIIRGGHNLDPRPIEEALLGHPDVAAAAVVGAPDPHAGEVPVAYLVLTSEARTDEAELLTWARDHAPEPAAAPKAVHLVESLPTTLIGKVFKPALVEDTVRRLVSAALDAAGLAGHVEVGTRDGRPHASVRLSGAGDLGALAADLDRYAFTYEVTA
ncbi:Long-chain-fatty-acid--CoA ligase [[Actinomadura] parvosata subsp. kistnae]|uniref:Long-chain fatty acid--CoA ligase n=1 Tax=[Actinomadura] parvosata subsp. kistnae TaxID=1909395 RepID=A0A1U9ZYH1_9ACTN|nr:acyl-CoA synthetase [Nonomuraea sp. ATCC 55076]AQZ63003.1 long-chain fatty acid--CoA ligase [Nonomuraea sp. ATCC 55076]SPL99975.1 Long-chain-fatty-acid--CoA ligase [Actinomadura parvosata subsp. kistnae]